jgi:hypothetical protein
MTMKYTIAECVARQRQVREEANDADAMTLTFAYELAKREVDAELPWGREPGTQVNARNEVVPIRAPRKEKMPTRRIVPISIDALVESDGDVTEAEASLEVEELMQPVPPPVAGADDEADEDVDAETERFENSDFASAEDDSGLVPTLEESDGDCDL